MRKEPFPRLALPSCLIVLTAALLLSAGCKSANAPRGDVSSEDQSSTKSPQPTAVPSRNPASVEEPPPAPPHRNHRGGNASIAAEPPAPPTDEQLLEQSLNKLKTGNLAYNTPGKMKAGQTARVTARIGSDKVSITTLESGMPGEPDAKTETASTPISTKMKMTLKGADFDIAPLSSEEQFVGGDTPTNWEWDVIPKHAGQLRLHLAATVELKDLSRDFTAIDREVAVNVDAVDAVTGFIQRNWQWLIATLTAIVGALWKFFSKNGKAAGEDASRSARAPGSGS